MSNTNEVRQQQQQQHRQRQQEESGQSPEERQHQQSQRSTGRKLAEWVTLGISTLLIVGVAVYLAYLWYRASPPFVPLEVRLLSDQVKETEPGQFVLPIEVRNGGAQTLQDVQCLVIYRDPAGEPQRREIQIPYLAAHASQRVYLFFDRPPGELRLEAKPSDYRIE